MIAPALRLRPPQRLTTEGLMNISEIAPTISITDARTARSPDLSQLGFTAVFCLDLNEYRAPHPDGGLREYHLAPLHALRCVHSHFEEAVEALKELLSHQNRVLVHCTHGVNRSIAVVAATICDLRLATDGIQALKHVQNARGKGDHLQGDYLALLRDRQGGSKRQGGQKTSDETPNI